jgi:glycyl-tRNA synthetase (class II)
VTVRDRDTWEQERVKVSELQEYLQKRLVGAGLAPARIVPQAQSMD